MLKITKTVENATACYALEGQLDTLTAPDLDKEWDSSLEGISELILDFEKLEYLSSAGIRTVLRAWKIMNKQGSMKLIHVNEMIMTIFEVTGCTDILTIEN